jgi:transcriptional regulator with XRE-family HTH domain
MSFANNLKSIMKDQNLNQTDLSNLTGIGKPSLSQYLSGKNTPYKSRVTEIAIALGVSPERLTAKMASVECEAPTIISNQKISIDEAARRLGKSKQFIRIALQNGVAPFGFATKGSGDSYDYHISPKLLDEYIGGQS